MANVVLVEIGLDAKGQLYAVPQDKDFEFIYRAARGAYWDAERRALVAPALGRLSCAQWLKLFCLAAQEEYGVVLELSPSTKWTAIGESERHEIEASFL